MYTDDEERRGFPVRDFLIRLVIIIVIVLLLMWLLPIKTNKNGSDLTPLTDRIFNANIQQMKEAAIPYFTTERLPKKVGDEVKLTLKEMLDLKLLLPFTDKNGDTCDVNNSYVMVTKDDNDYVLKVYLKCNDDEDYILVYIGCYSYCSSANGVCEKQEDSTPTTTKPTTSTQTTTPSGPSCVLEIVSGSKGSNGWYTGNVKVGFKSKKTTSSGAKITKYGLATSSSVSYNSKNDITISKDGTTKVYGFVKDSNGKTAVCTVTVKKDTVDPDCSVTVLKGTKNSNGKYVVDVTVGFNSKTDATSGVAAYGLDIKNTANYNGKSSYTVSKEGTTTVYGFVKDNAGHTKVCSTKVQVEKPSGVVSEPSCSLEVTSGTMGDNEWYRSNVVVKFKNKSTTNGATIVGWGFGPTENYNKSDSYTISQDGNYVVKGYVKDSNGYTSSCSITIKRDATKPSCSLGVTSGTKGSDGKYTTDVTIGWGSRSDATSGVAAYGIGKTTTYANNTSYTITTTGKHTIKGFIKDKAGNTNECSISVEKKSQTYEYEYAKKISAQYSSWSSWKTSEYDCNNPPSFTDTDIYQAEDLGSSQVIDSYEYKLGKEITAEVIKEVSTISEKSCTGWKYYRNSTITGGKTYAIATGGDYKYVGLVSVSAPPTSTLSTKYEFVGMDWDRCGSTCTSTPYTIWKKYTRNVSTVVSSDTIKQSNGVTVKCSSYETKNTILYSTYTPVVGYEKIRTIKYKKVCSYKYRNRTITKEAYTDYKWSFYNDQELLNAGYVMTGSKRLTN